MPPNKFRKKILELFEKIPDENLRIIISETLDIERENRNAHRFPTGRIEDIVDGVANLLEKKKVVEK